MAGIGRGFTPGAPWTDKDFLYDRYIKRKMTIYKIADECASLGFPTSYQTIFRSLRRFGFVEEQKPNTSRNSKKKGGGFYG